MVSFLKPLFDKYGVDIVLQGHDHAYARGSASLYEQNILSGTNVQDATGTVYVVSVSGSKQYEAKPNWDQYDAVRDKAGEDKQLFQVISIDGNTLSYKSYTAVGDLFDSFDLIKNSSNYKTLANKDKTQTFKISRNGNYLTIELNIVSHPIANEN